MKKRFFLTMLSLLTSTMLWAADDDTFTAKTVEGVEMTFRVISEEGKTAEVWRPASSYFNAPVAIDKATTGNVTIPSEANGYKVVSICEKAFYYCPYITSVVIPNGITKIAIGAFEGCESLEEANLPSSLTEIGNAAFYGIALRSVVIPASVKSIGNVPYGRCPNLTSILVESGNTSYDSRNNCNAIISTNDNRLIQACNTTTIPNGVTSIDRMAFKGCTRLKSLFIPASVTNINYTAFELCGNLETIEVENGNPVFSSPNNCNAIIKTASKTLFKGCVNTVIPDDIAVIGENAFQSVPIKTINLPNTVTAINDRAFENCTELTSFTIPEKVKIISVCSFYGCSGLKSVQIPEGITDIKGGAFQSCTGLESVVIPNSVTNIGSQAFLDCSNLKSLTIGSGVKSFNYCFAYCKALEKVISYIEEPENISYDVFLQSTSATLYVPKGTLDLYKSKTGWKDFANIVEMDLNLCPDNNHPHMIDLGLPSGTKWACCNVGADTPEAYGGYYAWGETETKASYSWSNYIHCDGSEETVHNIGSDIAGTNYDVAYVKWGEEWMMPTQMQCRELRTYGIPMVITRNGVEGMQITGTNGNSIFIPYAGEMIGTRNSGGKAECWTSTCESSSGDDIYAMTIRCNNADDFSRVNHRPFDDRDRGLTVRPVAAVSTNIKFADANVKAICVQNWDTNGDGELSYDEAEAVTDLGQVFKENDIITSFNELQFFTGLTAIGKAAFRRCSSLTSVTIPNSVTSIGEQGFYYCSSISAIELPASVTSIGYVAFGGCANAKTIRVAEGNTVYDSRNNCNAIIRTSSNELVLGCANTVIPNDVVKLGVLAFCDCQDLKSITLPAGLRNIGGWAFTHTPLTTVTIPENVTYIGYMAFMDCQRLTSINLPASIESLDEYVFSGCQNLSSVKSYIKNPFSISDNVFGTWETTALYVPFGTKSKYEATDGWKNFKNIVEMEGDVPTPTLADGLVAYYPFNGNANDESGNGNDGTVIGHVELAADRFGNPDSAYRFFGEPLNYISVPDDESLHCSTFTLSAWVYTDAEDYGSGYLINKGRDINNGSYHLYVRGIGATTEYGGVNDASIEEDPVTKVWHMATGTVEGDVARFYLDGVLMAEKILSHPFVYNNSDPLTLGMHYYEGVPDFWAYPLVGVLDDVRIYNRALSADEVKALYTMEDGLVAYYPFNGNANDESGNGNDGTVIGHVELAADRFGNPNSAYRFFGEPLNYISVPDAESLHCSTLTLSAWVYTDAEDYGNGYLINKGRDINDGAYHLEVRGLGATTEYGGVNGAWIEELPVTKVWHMVTGTVEGDVARYYLDGVLMDERTLSHPFVYDNTEPLTLGMHYYTGVPSIWAYPLLGVLDDVRIYSRALSPEEVKALYTMEMGGGTLPKGDVNGDNAVNVADIGNVIDVMAQGSNDPAADVNGDGVVNVADIAAIIDIMAGKGTEPENPDPQNPEEKVYTSCPDENHPHIIDLGLPSGTKWACCNVGASKPEDYGDYFAWGETQTKEVYSWETYIHCDGSQETCHNIGSDIAGTEYDAAAANWKAPWRMPTHEQCYELQFNCFWDWTTQDGVNGQKFTGPNGGSIFLPATGYWNDSGLNFTGTNGYYWSSTLGETHQSFAYGLDFSSNSTFSGDYMRANYRYYGRSIRPVR